MFKYDDNLTLKEPVNSETATTQVEFSIKVGITQFDLLISQDPFIRVSEEFCDVIDIESKSIQADTVVNVRYTAGDSVETGIYTSPATNYPDLLIACTKPELPSTISSIEKTEVENQQKYSYVKATMRLKDGTVESAEEAGIRICHHLDCYRTEIECDISARI